MERRFADFHTHILPGIDDGSANVEESLEMLRLLARQGAECVVATPHFYANYDSPERFLRKRQAAIDALVEAVADETELPELRFGAEVYYFNGISQCDALPDLVISGTRGLLVEMPMQHWSDQMLWELREIHEKWGLVPIVAHIDRYIRPFRARCLLERLAQLPVVIQANANFFIQRSTRRLALRMLKKGDIHLLGSDCHNRTTRIPNLGDALEIISNSGDDDSLNRVHHLERELLSGV